MAQTPHEHWAAGDAYEQFMGRWSWNVAARFLEWLNRASNQRWLDVGCGTGALTRAISAVAEPRTVVGIDPSFGFVQFANQQPNKASYLAADAGALPVVDEAFDAVVSGLALNFMPEPHQALLEMRRVVKQDGLVAAYVWDYAGKMEYLRYFWDAAVELDAKAGALHEGRRFPICQPEPLNQLWQSAGLNNVKVDALEIPTVFDTFESYWKPFTQGRFPAPNYVSSLDETQRGDLRDRLCTALPTASDGSIHLTARVWGVRGYR